jgi:hypothetical protein
MAAAEEEIATLEAERDELHTALATAEAGTDFAIMNRRLADIENRLAELNDAWETDGLALEELAAELQREMEAD